MRATRSTTTRKLRNTPARNLITKKKSTRPPKKTTKKAPTKTQKKKRKKKTQSKDQTHIFPVRPVESNLNPVGKWVTDKLKDMGPLPTSYQIRTTSTPALLIDAGKNTIVAQILPKSPQENRSPLQLHQSRFEEVNEENENDYLPPLLPPPPLAAAATTLPKTNLQSQNSENPKSQSEFLFPYQENQNLSEVENMEIEPPLPPSPVEPLRRETRSQAARSTKVIPSPSKRVIGKNKPKRRPGGLHDKYYNPKSIEVYSRLNRKKYARMNPSISRHKKIITKFDRNSIISPGLYTTLFADLCLAYNQPRFFMKNGGKKYILVVVCPLSKQLFTEAMTTKKGPEVTAKMEKILGRMVNLPGHILLVTDQGKEFIYQGFTKTMREEWGIQPTYLQGKHKASIAERYM